MAATSTDDGPRRSYRFALRPLWLLSHLLVLAAVVVMVNLGLWQLRRLDERREFNDTVEANASAEPVPLATLLAGLGGDGGDGTNGAGLHDDAIDAIEWRPVVVEGTYRQGADVLVANRALDGQPGYWVVTPFEPADGSDAVAVVRGFVTRAFVAQGDLREAAAPDGVQTVTGYVQESRGGGRFATGLDEGELPQISAVDVGKLAEHWGIDLAPVWLQRSAPGDDAPGGGDPLTAVPLPDLGEGPHLSYAVQWFLFATIAAVGYPLIIRRNARIPTPASG